MKRSIIQTQDERVRRLVGLCQSRHVVHVGCADVPFTQEKLISGDLLHAHLLEVAKSCIGVDVDEHGLSLLRNAWPGEYLLTPQELSELRPLDTEIVVAGEVVEHLSDIGSFFTWLADFCHPNVRLIITTPNAYSFKAALRALLGREVQHPDHVALYSTKTLVGVAERFGFELSCAAYYCNPPRSLRSAPAGFLLNALLKLAPRASDGLFFEFRRKCAS